ncbi:bifunctional N(6)-L-threonylcarbamoyladenine synthase/serine/threonine protein kinase [Candidatus Woesearchaeota archaeon]|nr:MAG: bifunctional N(6)-L-threonylcarbamoyladenine synthase/serine/threonine protein kinase [Candidatus Woesearchaeota archaeon]
MICLGIESTAHTFGVGIVNDKGQILANEKDAYTTKSGGLIPNKLAEHHVECCDAVWKNALRKAKLSMKDIDVVSYSASPGLGHALRIGAMFARSIAKIYKKPLVGCNHCIAHLEIGRMISRAKDPVLLYVSGVNTQVIAYESGKYRIFGETLDQGIGNFLDSFARHIGLGFPGGPKIAELAKKGKNYIELPYTVKGMDVSFGGLLTNVKQKYDSGKYKVEDICFSIQETVFAMLTEVSERALAHCNKDELVLGGGVACNTRLQEMVKIMCSERKAKCYIPENRLLVDNAAMIAWLGLIMFKAGNSVKPKEAGINPYERTDDVRVNWR